MTDDSDWDRFTEPWRTTLLRTSSIAVAVGLGAGLVTGRLSAVPGTILVALWVSLGGHFVESRLRFHLDTNDFSEHLRIWGLEDAARKVNDLDIYSNTLYQLRDRIPALVESEMRTRARAAARPAEAERRS